MSLTFHIFDFSETTERNFDETWQEARTQGALPSLCFWGCLEKKDGHLACDGWDIINFSATTEKNSEKKNKRKQELSILY